MTTAAPSRLRLLPVLLLACVVMLCLTGMARPAMATPGMTGSMPSMDMGEMMPGMHAAENGAAPAVSDPHSFQQTCPMSSVSDCAQPSVPPVAGDQSGCAHAEDAPAPAFAQPGPPRSGVPPPLASPSPPELTRLCVSRT
ncbi:hypothetical protein Q5762_26840 [Streptomyces sp. P9(2023)]|uniref:hypothetical protein n=1 Tax=Streptomyces sp. P9(2023) TaxID=3064394 RepID=UPI0028F419A1|nr:hypothetical protein [Streptomyces sp. P9(2023)]MDT9691884.1 hypothetical protein [Streptomyces sp. P9(2023)]